MRQLSKDKIKNNLEKRLGRTASQNEIANSETDALLLAQLANERLDELEDKLDNFINKP